jgi:hypothetical protein
MNLLPAQSPRRVGDKRVDMMMMGSSGMDEELAVTVMM